MILTPDDSTILCADKFGDVYSLPLLGQAYDSNIDNDDAKQNTKNDVNGRPQKSFVPAATALTVHTKGNREALRQQQKISNPKSEKKSLNFEHQLLLGHVSLLTDVACISADSFSKKERTFIFTSDRDEHIRVSRGIPQAHVIEGYCLGHTEFVSKLCISPAIPDFLVSGGGDDYLLTWNWPTGTVQQKVDLRGPIEAFIDQHRAGLTADSQVAEIVEEKKESKFAVSNILTRQNRAIGIIDNEYILTFEG